MNPNLNTYNNLINYSNSIERHELVISKRATAQGLNKYYLDELTHMRGHHIVGIYAICGDNVPKTDTNLPVVNRLIFQRSFLTLKCQSTEAITKIPLAVIENDGTGRYPYTKIDLVNLSVEESYITNNDDVILASNIDMYYMLGFIYRVVTPYEHKLIRNFKTLTSSREVAIQDLSLKQ